MCVVVDGIVEAELVAVDSVSSVAFFDGVDAVAGVDS